LNFVCVSENQDFIYGGEEVRHIGPAYQEGAVSPDMCALLSLKV
jgi:hypothetical protein